MAETGGKVVVRQVTWLQRLVLWIFYVPVRLYYASLRYRTSGESLVALSYCEKPAVVTIWHNRIMTSPGIKHRYFAKRRMSAAISASRDGALISAFVGMLGIDACRGSSSKRGAMVALELVEELKGGRNVAVTPDGPRGPLYTFHEGAAAVALIAGAPVTLVCPVVKRGMRFNSWDGFYLPWPFSRIEMLAKHFEPESLPKDRAECAEFLRAEMMKLTEDMPEPPRTKALREKAAAKKTDNPGKVAS